MRGQAHTLSQYGRSSWRSHESFTSIPVKTGLAGPHCTKALRDLGADVTKIEPPSGDLGRVGLPYVNGIGLYYVQQNAGKRNLSLDLNYVEAREVVTQL